MLKERVILKFGDFALDPVAKVLFRAGQPVHLTRKGVETLLVLARNSGQVLTKEEIMAAVWADRVVDDANLAQNIAVVRRALGAPKGDPAHIETFPGRGYRLEGPVLSAVEAPAPAPAEREPTRPFRIWPALACVVLLSGGWIVWKAIKTDEPSSASPSLLRVVPATRMPGKEYQPAVSPDGKRLAFLWVEDGTKPPAVWIQSSLGEAGRQLSKGGAHHSSPVWSPDGGRLAYLRIQRASTDIVITDLNASTERTAARLEEPTYGFDHRRMDWSPDGQWLVVSSDSALKLIHATSGERRTLTAPAAGASGDVDPRFSPDGSSVSFIRLIHRAQQEIFSVPLKGGPPRQLTTLGRLISGYDWTPDGKSLVFASDHGGDFRLWRLRLSAGDGGRTATPLSVYSEFPIQLSTARKADILVYSALQQDRNIWCLDLRSLEWKRLIASSGQDASPQYSPQGDRICFRSDRSGEEQLWVSGADGSNPTQVTRSSVRPSVGRWAPDGNSIVFNSPQNSEVFLASAENGAWAVRSTGVKGVHPVFSHDGQWIYAADQPPSCASRERADQLPQ